MHEKSYQQYPLFDYFNVENEAKRHCLTKKMIDKNVFLFVIYAFKFKHLFYLNMPKQSL
ncbi:hypothetical protein SAMN05444359_106139 [Neolewinella agarilytica]|uniref:Uncharacterized protein n=1 Tax=Neolewinella agarilytica TaxID=478744 RepID=A0A1H9DUY7_9BACT|nr:hypothetical protein SAMN05444359_106139 [Neolewinella agarilytica]